LKFWSTLHWSVCDDVCVSEVVTEMEVENESLTLQTSGMPAVTETDMLSEMVVEKVQL